MVTAWISCIHEFVAFKNNCSPGFSSAGEHLLATAKRSLLNQLATPFLGAGARLFIAAGLPAASSGNAAGAGAADRPALLPLLTALRQVRAVCTKGAAASGLAASGIPASWLPCSQFCQEVEQQQQAERQRQAEAAALAAAEAARREKLQAAAQAQRRNDEFQLLEFSSGQPARLVAQQQEEEAEQAAGSGTPQPQNHSSPAGRDTQGAQPAAPLQQEPQAASAAALENSAHEADPPAEQAGPASLLLPQRGGPSSTNCSGSSLDHLREQFQRLYGALAGPQGAAGAAAGTGESGSPAGCCQSPAGRPADGQTSSPSSAMRQQQQQKQQAGQVRTIAQGVAAADDIATHVAVLRMQAAAEARRALLAQQQVLGSKPGTASVASASAHDSPAAGAVREPADAVFAWTPSQSSCTRPGSGSLGQKLEAELQQLQREAAARMAAATTPEQSGTPQASLAELEAGLSSLAAVFRGATSRAAAGDGSVGQRSPGHGAQSRAAGASATDDASPSGWPAREPPKCPGSAGASDLFQSGRTLLFTPQGGSTTRAAAAAASAAGPGGTQQPASPDNAHWELGGHLASSSSELAGGSDGLQHGLRQQADQEARQADGHDVGNCSSSYAASWQQQLASPLSAAACAAAASASNAAAHGDLGRKTCSSSSSSARLAPQQYTPPCKSPASCATPAPAGSSQQGAPEACALLEELQREQRVNAALLRQLHKVQQALEEAVAAVAAAQQPLAPGVDDPADFNGLLAGAGLPRCMLAEIDLWKWVINPITYKLDPPPTDSSCCTSAPVLCKRALTLLLSKIPPAVQPSSESGSRPPSCSASCCCSGSRGRSVSWHWSPACTPCSSSCLWRRPGERWRARLAERCISSHAASCQWRRPSRTDRASMRCSHAFCAQLWVRTAGTTFFERAPLHVTVLLDRCRAWEQGLPLAQLFQRADDELQREQAKGLRLEEENRQLAALLADADLDRLTGQHACSRSRVPLATPCFLLAPPPATSGWQACILGSTSCFPCRPTAKAAYRHTAGAAAQLGDEAAAALCREHQRQLAQAQGKLRKLQEQRGALQKELQAAQRRDRLAELCRRQVGVWGGVGH